MATKQKEAEEETEAERREMVTEDSEECLYCGGKLKESTHDRLNDFMCSRCLRYWDVGDTLEDGI